MRVCSSSNFTDVEFGEVFFFFNTFANLSSILLLFNLYSLDGGRGRFFWRREQNCFLSQVPQAGSTLGDEETAVGGEGGSLWSSQG